jgi:trimeric autotransporter adhesin
VFGCFALLPRAHAVVTDPDDYFTNHTTAVGEQALLNLTSGIDNTAAGWHALPSNTTGSQNTVTGRTALASNTTGSVNTANGYLALSQNTTGGQNTATGVAALSSNTSGGSNTATGVQALFQNRGSLNTANGTGALYHNTTAFFNTAMGSQALFNNTTGFSNIALGFQAGMNLTTGSNNIDIGNAGVAGDFNKIRIGKQGTHNGTFIAGISGVAVSGSQVGVNAMGKLGVATSSARFKDQIKRMKEASEVIYDLRPVSFRCKPEIDPESIPQFGLVAEDVEKVNADPVLRDKEGKPYTVRYGAVNAMLLNEFLKQHHQVQDLKAIVANQQKQIEALTAGLQKVSAQLEASKPAP